MDKDKRLVEGSLRERLTGVGWEGEDGNNLRNNILICDRKIDLVSEAKHLWALLPGCILLLQPYGL